MKKNLLTILLALAMLLALTACGGEKEPAPEEEKTPAEDVVIEPEVVDPESDVPAEPTEEPDVAPEMPTVGEETPEVTPEVEPEAKPEEKPADKPVEQPKPEAPSAPAAGQSADLQAFYESLLTTYGENFPANMNMCEMQDVQDSFYPGLSAIGTNQLMIYQPMMGAVVCEIALAEVSNAADVDAVKAIFQSRIDAQVDGGAWYPESIEGWKANSRVVANGNYVMMIAYSECDAVVDAFNGLFA